MVRLTEFPVLALVRTILAGWLVLTVVPGWTDSLAMGPGVMGAGTMGPGMMGSAPRQAESGSEDAGHGGRLVAYIRDQRLTCLQCHGVETPGFGPAFEMIAGSYEKQPDAERVLADHIAHGYGRMPGGLASDAQAAQLAKMILELPNEGRVQ